MRWDHRSNRPNLIQGSGAPLIPGRGNKLRNKDIGVAAAKTITLNKVAEAAQAFAHDHAALLGTANMTFRFQRDASSELGNDGRHWNIRLAQYYQGVAIHDAYLYFRISNGNIVQFGSHRVAPVQIDVHPAQDRADAFNTAFRQMPFRKGARVAKVREPGELLIMPSMATPQQPGTRYLGAKGEGYSHVLVWRFVFTLHDDRSTYEVLMNAHNNKLLQVRDLNTYSQATVDGGIYPAGRSPEQVVPFPFVSVENSGSKVTDLDGNYDYAGGTASTSLSGKYFNIQDDCGSISLSDNTDGNLNFGSSGGTDCATPGFGGSGNTHASRTGFYHLTMINRTAKTYLPNEAWLDSTVTVNVNINDSCNAYWNGFSLNFFKSSATCANTGEIPGVFLHEWGHGMDQHHGGAAPEHGSGEAVGDTFAMLYTETGCIGNGFNTNQSGPCTGVRYPASFSVHDQSQGHPIAKPSTIEQFAGTSCPYYTPQNQPYQGVMGYEGHRESLIISSANWDLIQNLVGEYGSEQGFDIMKDIWYGSLSATSSAYQIESGGKCNPQAQINGCAADNYYTSYLATDDDDGNLSNGTPNACRIWDAFDAHGIACGTRPSCTSGANPDFSIGTDTPQQAICAPGDTSYTINVGSRKDFDDPVSLSVDGLPTGVTASFATNPVIPGNSTQLTLSAGANAAADEYTINVNGTATNSPGHGMALELVITTEAPAAPVLQAPTDGATSVPVAPTLTWEADSNAASYTVEIASDAAFDDIVDSQSGITSRSYTADNLDYETTYYWRVTADNACGTSAPSASSDFTTVMANPPKSYIILGNVSGLQGDGLTLQLNGAHDKAVSSNGAFMFSTEVPAGETYAVTVLTQPTSPAQTCTVKHGTGTISDKNISDVKVTCGDFVPTFSVGGTITGLIGNGLVLQLNGANDLAVNGSAFTFGHELADAEDYAVTVAEQPQSPAQLCTVTNGSGTINGDDVDDVVVECASPITDRIFADGFELPEPVASMTH